MIEHSCSDCFKVVEIAIEFYLSDFILLSAFVSSCFFKLFQIFCRKKYTEVLRLFKETVTITVTATVNYVKLCAATR